MVCFFYYFATGETIETPFDLNENVKSYGLAKCANVVQWAFETRAISELLARDLLRALSEIRSAKLKDGFTYLLRTE